jgi:O-antigen/teichoic acid export membrane protein
VQIFRILPDLGMAYSSTLEISRDTARASRLGSVLLGLQLVLASGTVVLCILVGTLLYRAPGEHVVLVVVLILSGDLVLKTIKGTLRFLLKGLQSFGTEAVSLGLERSLLLVVGLLALRSGRGVVGYALAFLVVRLPDTLGLWGYMNAFVVKLKPVLEPSLWRERIGRGLPFAYTGVMVSLLFLVDTLLLEKISGAEAAGFYGVPVQILEGLALVPRVVSYALLPTMAAAFARAPAEVTGVYRRGLKYLLLVGFPVAAFGILASPAFVPAIFGAPYAPSVVLSQAVVPIAVLMFVSNFSETTLFCIERWRSLVWISTTALLIDLVLALALIPGRGPMGAAMARLGGEGSYAILTAWAVSRAGHGPAWGPLAAKPLLCALAFGGALGFLGGTSLLVATPVAGVVWILATIVLKVWDEKEQDLLRGLLRS